MSSLVVVESPHKAKTITKILGPDYIVRATVGHIVDLKKGNGSLGVNIEKGFKPQYNIIPDKKDKIKSIIDAARQVSKIYIASDPDREGEAIAFAVADQLKKINVPIYRSEFLEITPRAVKAGIEFPRELDKDLYAAQQARRVLDRIVGFLVSPYLIKKFSDSLSAGRVQSVALRLIVEREDEILSFVPEEYWTINAHLEKDGKKFTARYNNKIDSKTKNDSILADLKNNSDFIVTDVVSSKKEKPPLPPLTTSTLQQIASAKFKLSADKTMAAAQSLYESGYISYIRTDSTRNSPESIKEARAYLSGRKLQIPKAPNIYKNKNSSQDAHEALRPTDVNNFPMLHGDQEKIYNLIWSRFVASQMTPAIYDTVDVKIKSGKHLFVAGGRVLKDEGWLKIASSYVKSDKDILLPDLLKNDILTLIKPGVVSELKQTKPPSRFTDGTLVKELEKKEIGRPSTYATILKRISGKKYIKQTKNGFEPTDVGRLIVDDLKKYFSFMDYKYTAQMENELDKIASGKLKYEDMLKKFFKPFKEEFNKARASQGKDAGIKCPKCGNSTIVRHSKYGYFAGCVNFPDCRGSVGLEVKDGQMVVKEKPVLIDGIVCPECGSGMFKRDGKFGPYYSCIDYFKCFGKRKIPFGKECSKCSGEMHLTIFNGIMKLACMEYPECQNIEPLPKDAKVDWVDPKDIALPVFNHKVEKAVKKIK